MVAPASRPSLSRSRSSDRVSSHRLRPTRPRRMPSRGMRRPRRTARRDPARDCHGRRRKHAADRRRARDRGLDRSERLARGSRHGCLRQRRAERDAPAGGAVNVVFGVSAAGGGTWTYIDSDASAPFGTSFDTATLADGLYDLRAVGYDALGNASAPSVRANVRFDNTAPQLVSSAPADGSVSASASQIVLTASEPVTAVGVLLDGAATPPPSISGSTLDLHHRRARRGPARPHGPARGRERHPRPVPRRRHDREHA